MKIPPQAFCTQTSTLSHAIRHAEPSELAHSNLRHYYHFIRAHIIEVIENTFQHFNRLISAEDKIRYADDFIRNHSAIEPEFHQIATEFVRFMQNYPLQDPRLLSVIEYDWVIFSVSILPNRIDAAKAPIHLHQICEDQCVITLNPTSCYLEVPFLVTQEGLDFSEGKKFFYAIFRNAEHQVLYQLLTAQERYLVQLIREVENMTYGDLIRQAPFISVEMLNNWLVTSYLSRFIDIN